MEEVENRKPRSLKMNCQFAAIYLTAVSWKIHINDRTSYLFFSFRVKTFNLFSRCEFVGSFDAGKNIMKLMKTLRDFKRKLEYNSFKNVSKWPPFLWRTQIQTTEYGLNDTIRNKRKKFYWYLTPFTPYNMNF